MQGRTKDAVRWVLRLAVAMIAVPILSDAAMCGDRRLPSLKDGHAVPSGSVEQRSLGFYGDQRGCYWRRGERHCSRYCYWEVDGYRYCTDKERYARPQGDPWFAAYPPEPPIYLRPPHARP